MNSRSHGAREEDVLTGLLALLGLLWIRPGLQLVFFEILRARRLDEVDVARHDRRALIELVQVPARSRILRSHPARREGAPLAQGARGRACPPPRIYSGMKLQMWSSRVFILAASSPAWAKQAFAAYDSSVSLRLGALRLRLFNTLSILSASSSLAIAIAASAAGTMSSSVVLRSLGTRVLGSRLSPGRRAAGSRALSCRGSDRLSSRFAPR